MWVKYIIGSVIIPGQSFLVQVKSFEKYVVVYKAKCLNISAWHWEMSFSSWVSDHNILGSSLSLLEYGNNQPLWLWCSGKHFHGTWLLFFSFIVIGCFIPNQSASSKIITKYAFYFNILISTSEWCWRQQLKL